MPRHQQQESIRLACPARSARPQFLMRREHLLLFARVRTAGYPDGSGAEGSAQRTPPIGRPCAQFHVELDVADHVSFAALRAYRHKSLGVLGGLRRYQRSGGENSSKQTAETSIARNRFRRQPRARKHQGHAAVFAFLEQIGPEFGFHDDGKPRPNAVQESRDRSRCVVR